MRLLQKTHQPSSSPQPSLHSSIFRHSVPFKHNNHASRWLHTWTKWSCWHEDVHLCGLKRVKSLLLIKDLANSTMSALFSAPLSQNTDCAFATYDVVKDETASVPEFSPTGPQWALVSIKDAFQQLQGSTKQLAANSTSALETESCWIWATATKLAVYQMYLRVIAKCYKTQWARQL